MGFQQKLNKWKPQLSKSFLKTKKTTPQNEGQKIISIKNFSLGFEQAVNGKIKQILNDINLDIYRGEKLAIIGESGSGKTVLSNAIACLLANDAKKVGEIIVDGVDVVNLSEAQINKHQIRGNKVSYVFQNPLQTMNPYMKIGDQLIETLKFKGSSFKSRLNFKKEAKKHILGVLKDLNLANPEAVYNAYPHQLSGGMIQRVVIGCSILLSPKVLILDEPTSALDAVVEIQILELLNKIAANGTTIILISHDLNLVSSFANRIAVMYAGRVVEVGTNREINLNPQHPYTWGLLQSIPSYGQPLYSIPGRVPADLSTIVGDPFASRNLDYALKIDFLRTPPTFQISKTHFVSSWLLSHYAPKYTPPAKILERWTAFANNANLAEAQIQFTPQIYRGEGDLQNAIIHWKKLNIVYANNRNLNKVVHDVDIHINQGEIVGLIGESGSGKSTIAKAIAGLIDFSAETATILGVESPRHAKEVVGPTRTRFAKSLQMIYQNPSASLNAFKKLWRIVGEALFHHADFLNFSLNNLLDKKIVIERELSQTLIYKQILIIEQYKQELGYLIQQFKNQRFLLRHEWQAVRKQLINKFWLDLEVSGFGVGWYCRLMPQFLQLRYVSGVKTRFVGTKSQLANYKVQRLNAFDQERQQLVKKIELLKKKILNAKIKLHELSSNPQNRTQYNKKKLELMRLNKEIRGLKRRSPKLSKDLVWKKVASMLEQVGLSEKHMEMYAWQLSGGQQQRAAIARALIIKPRLLIADEPIASLDVSLQSGVISLIGDLIQKNNMSTLFISHDLEMLSQISDRVYVLYRGRVVEKGSAIQIFANPIHPYTKMLVSSSKNKGYKKDLSKIHVFDPERDYLPQGTQYGFYQIKNYNHFVYGNEVEIMKWQRQR